MNRASLIALLKKRLARRQAELEGLRRMRPEAIAEEELALQAAAVAGAVSELESLLEEIGG